MLAIVLGDTPLPVDKGFEGRSPGFRVAVSVRPSRTRVQWHGVNLNSPITVAGAAPAFQHLCEKRTSADRIPF
jgi:hypothetical protein